MAAYRQIEESIAQSDLEYTAPQPLEFEAKWISYCSSHPPHAFGIEIKSLFLLDPNLIYLAHGSYGAALKPILDARHSWSTLIESNPVHFYYKLLFPYLVRTLRQVASFVGSIPRNLVFVTNVEFGIQSVLNSVPVSEGDVWVCFDLTYEAVRHSMEFIATRRGAVVSIIPTTTPITSDSIINNFKNHVELYNGKCSLACFEHITSPTAIVMPVAKLIQVCKAKHILSLIDGAHTIGQIPLSLDSLCPDYYVSNCHKWLCTPRGAAILCTNSLIQTSMHIGISSNRRSFHGVLTRVSTLNSFGAVQVTMRLFCPFI